MTTSRWQPRLYAIILAAIALALVAGGGKLLALGGSPYYLLAGTALGGTAVLMWRQQRAALALYVAIIAATLIWSIWEVGFDGWALMPRLVAWFVVGAWMTTPWFRNSLHPANTGTGQSKLYTWKTAGLAFLVALIAGTALQPWRPHAPDPRFQTGFGAFPAKRLAGTAANPSGDWQNWGNDKGGSRFSPLEQITPTNVGSLQVAWTAPLFDSEAGKTGGLQVSPLVIGGTIYACNNVNETFAIDAETGARRWVHPAAGAKGRTCRGVAFYKVPNATGTCSERIVTATNTAKLIALDAATGQLCAGFGKGGSVNLLEGLSEAPEGYYHVTSAPEIVNGKIVLGGWVSDVQFWGSPSGVIRAFDAVTGELSWAWDMGRPDRTGIPAPGETYTPATPNSWAPISSDEKLGLVFLPTGNANNDYFGGDRRPFDDKYSSSLVAIDTATGKVRWSFQTVHHDVWDYDVASQPILVDLAMGTGAKVPAVVQLTKRGEIFVLNRETGQPLHPVTELPVPQRGKVPEERLSPTQPFSLAMPSFRNTDILESDMWGITPLDQLWCRVRFKGARYDGTLTPPGLSRSIQSPGYIGGMDWGGGSVDPERGVLVVNSVRLANVIQLITRAEADREGLKPVGPGAAGIDISGAGAQFGSPYAIRRTPFLSPLRNPCQDPPFGYLSAIDLVTGKLVWSRSIGEQGGLQLGTPNVGGSITTRAGLVFIAATTDEKFRAIELATGKELWKASLPRGAFSTPVTYYSQKSGRQFVVVAAGGIASFGTANGAELVAYALPAPAR